MWGLCDFYCHLSSRYLNVSVRVSVPTYSVGDYVLHIICCINFCYATPLRGGVDLSEWYASHYKELYYAMFDSQWQ
jgi:hypothetical protein